MKVIVKIISLCAFLALSMSVPLTAQSLTEFLFGQRVSKTVADPGLDVSSEAYLDSVIANTPLKQKIGQLFFIPAEGRFINRDSRSFKKLEELVEDYHVGGIIFMRGDIYGQAVLTNKLQRMAKFPLWISQDILTGVKGSGPSHF